MMEVSIPSGKESSACEYPSICRYAVLLGGLAIGLWVGVENEATDYEN